MRYVFLTLIVALAACSAETTPDSAPATPAPAPFALPQPHVVMQADPPPPQTYWAPEGSTIINHPDVPGIWYATRNGDRVETYFGDACHASDYQRFVGQPRASMPQPPADTELRTSCTTCPVHSDLRANRINVLFNEQTQVIEKIACY
jgi:hypothetical protein